MYGADQANNIVKLIFLGKLPFLKLQRHKAQDGGRQSHHGRVVNVWELA